MDKCTLTENMKIWLKRLYLEQAEEHLATASNCHLWALGSETTESATQFEEFAEEHRDFAHILRCMAEELNLE